MTKVRLSFAALFLGAAFAHGASAADCPDLGLTSPADQQRFCAELMALLYAPYNPSVDRGPNETSSGNDEIDNAIVTIPELAEAYRSDPKDTLDLIQRIRAAGGLNR